MDTSDTLGENAQYDSPHGNMVLDIAQKIINRYLALDPEISSQLGDLKGKCIKIDITIPEITAFCFPHTSRLEIYSTTEQKPDCIIRGSLIELIKLTKADNPAAALSAGSIIIEGDNRLAQKFSDILSEVDADWEEQLSHFTGDFIASRFGKTLKQGEQWLQRGLSLLRSDTSEYLRKESSLLPTRIEIERFISDVDQCRDGLERLEVKINRLIREITLQ